jgi:hypothetical protein
MPRRAKFRAEVAGNRTKNGITLPATSSVIAAAIAVTVLGRVL